MSLSEIRNRKRALADVLEADVALARKLAQQIRHTHDAPTICKLAAAFERASKSVRETILLERQLEVQEREAIKAHGETMRRIRDRRVMRAAGEAPSQLKH
jgi:hypothetical protein